MSDMDEITRAVEGAMVRTALLARSRGVLLHALRNAGEAFVEAGMEKEADAVIAALAEANAILEEAKG